MAKLHVEYFGPAKKFTHDRESDSIEVGSTLVADVIKQVSKIYGVEFVMYIISCCGVVVDDEYIELHERETPSVVEERADNYDEFIDRVFGSAQFKDNDEIVIVPPVSSG